MSHTLPVANMLVNYVFCKIYIFLFYFSLKLKQIIFKIELGLNFKTLLSLIGRSRRYYRRCSHGRLSRQRQTYRWVRRILARHLRSRERRVPEHLQDRHRLLRRRPGQASRLLPGAHHRQAEVILRI